MAIITLTKDPSPPATQTQVSPITIADGTTLLTTKLLNDFIDKMGGESPLTVSRVLQTDFEGNLQVSSVTTTELGYVSGVTSAIQTQLNKKPETNSTLEMELVATDDSLENTHNTAGHHNLITHNGKQYIAYYDADRYITLGERTLTPSAKGAWTFNKLDASKAIPKRLGDFGDNHDNITLGFDENDKLHISWGMHNDALLYFMMPNANSVSGEPGANLAMVGTNETTVSYPHFFNRPSDGKLFFMFRNTLQDRYMYEYNSGTDTWTAATGTGTGGLFVQAPGDGLRDRAYPSYPFMNGDVACFVWNWYDNTAPHGGDLFYLEYDTSAGTFAKADETAQTIPVIPSNDDVIKTISPPDGAGLGTMGDRNLYVDSTTGKISVIVQYTDSDGNVQLYLHTHTGTSGGSWDAGVQLTNRVADRTDKGYNPLLVHPTTGIWYLLYSSDVESYNMMCIESRDAGTTWSNPYPVFAPKIRRAEVAIDFAFWDANGEIYMPYEGTFDVDNGDASNEHITHKKRYLYLEHWIPSEGKTRVDSQNNTILSKDDINIRSFDGRVNIGDEVIIGVSENRNVEFEASTLDTKISEYVYGSFGPKFNYYRALGTKRSPSSVADGSTVGSTVYYAHDGTNFEAVASISTVIEGTPATGNLPAQIRFSNRKDGDSSTTTNFIIYENGDVMTISESSLSAQMGLKQHSSNTTTSVFKQMKSRGSESSPSAVIDGDILGLYRNQAYIDGAYRNVFEIRPTISGTPSATSYATAIAFNSVKTDDVALTARMTFDEQGRMNLHDNAMLNVNSIGLGGTPTDNFTMVDKSTKDGTTTSRNWRMEHTINPLASGVATNGLDYIPNITIADGADHISGYQFRPNLSDPGVASTIDFLGGFSNSFYTIPNNVLVNSIRGYTLNDPATSGTGAFTNFYGLRTTGLKNATSGNYLIHSQGGDVFLQAKDSTYTNVFEMQRYTNTGADVGNNILLRRSRGTSTTPVTVQSGDRLAFLAAYGHDATGFIPASSIKFLVDGVPGTNDMPGSIVFATTPNGSASTVDRWVLKNDGSVEGFVYDEDATGNSITNLDIASVKAGSSLVEAAIPFVIDGGGSAITTGIKGDVEVPFDCTIQSVRLLADQSGSIAIDIWKDTYANYPATDADSITGSAVPTISSAIKSEDTSLTGWTTTLSKGDIIRFNVDSITTVQRVTVSLLVNRT